MSKSRGIAVSKTQLSPHKGKLEQYWIEIYWTLNASRNDPHMPINFNSIIEYGKFYHFDENEIELLLHVIMLMDAVWLKHLQKKLKKGFN